MIFMEQKERNVEDDLGAFLISLVSQIKGQLKEYSENEVSIRPSDDKWSRKEILGHLVDSACNNHRRFVIFREQDHLHFDGYDQEEWVKTQQYADYDWTALVDLWHAYNVHIGKVIQNIPADLLEKETLDHNFDKVAFRRVPAGQPSSMQYFIKDYILHLQHHIDQIHDETR